MGPRVCMLVANDIRRDSRVQKVAYSAAEAGYEVLLLGFIPVSSPEQPGEAAIGAARVVRTRLTNRYREAARRDREQLPPGGAARLVGRARIAGLRGASYAAVTNFKVRRRVLQRIAEPGTGKPGLKGRGKELLWRLYVRDGHWSRTQLHLPQIEAAWAPIIDAFDPDLIHAHDMHTPAIAVHAKERAARRGRSVKVVYDAHEFVAGVRMGTLRELAYQGLERESIRHADAVVTVSPQLAGLLKDRYGLGETPTVVTNAPMFHLPAAGDGEAPGTASGAMHDTLDGRIAAASDAEARAKAGIRVDAGLGPGVPLIVYSGAVAPARGIVTMAEALATLQDVHMALVCGEETRFTAEVREAAARAGAADRLHVLPYVPAQQVSAYLSSATLGVIPILHSNLNHEVALITKYYEYMHAGLPIVTSDVEAMAAKTRELGNGEVFVAGDAASLAAAVEKVLADRAAYAAAYTPELLAENSWERQAEILCRLYGTLLGRVPEPHGGHRRFSFETVRPETEPPGTWPTGDLPPGEPGPEEPPSAEAPPPVETRTT